MSVRLTTIALSICTMLLATGCVRRTVTINTQPQGALIWLNDEEVGRSPVTVDFLWYGDYSVTARLDGYETLNTHQKLACPWYQYPGIDFVTEVLYAGQIHDEQEMNFALKQEETPDREGLLQRAEAFRDKTLFESE